MRAVSMERKRERSCLQDEREAVYAFFGDEYRCYETESQTKEEVEESIMDCHMMLLWAIERQDKEEISFWRKHLQENKVRKRSIPAM